MENFSINSALTDAQLISVVESQGRFVNFVSTEMNFKTIEFWDSRWENSFLVDRGLSLAVLISKLIEKEIKDARYLGEQDAKREIRYVLGIE